MRLVLYSLKGDERKALGIAKMTGDIYRGPNGGNGDGITIHMSFSRAHATRKRYVLDDDTKMSIAGAVGLLDSIDEVVVLMHAAPGRLSPAGGVSGGLAIPEGSSWCLDDLRDLLRAWAPRRIYFLCCEFGKPRALNVIAGYQVADGPSYMAQGLKPGTEIFALTAVAMVVQQMPVLRATYYNKKVTA
jgi:hypothetical protein